MPHPSGITVNRDSIFVISTRTPHLLVEIKSTSSLDDNKSVLMPFFSRYLPGSLYAHELLYKDNLLYYNATGWNEIHKIDSQLRAPIKQYFMPEFISKRKKNCCQINSLSFSLSLIHI